MSDKPSDLGKTPAHAVKRLRADALECLGTRIGLHIHAEANAVEALMAEADALRERAERAEDEASILTQARDEASAERDRHREAVRRLRDLADEAANDPDVHHRVQERARHVLAATTDEAIQGYPEPPGPLPHHTPLTKPTGDARGWSNPWPAPRSGMVENAALVAEVAELRAELAAERGEAEGAIGDGWWPGRTTEARDNGWLWYRYDTGVTLAVTHDRIEIRDRRGVVASIRREDASIRAAMRAAEAEARRLGLIGEVEHG